MPKMIFLNLPVTDLAKASKFYEAIGGVKNPKFSDDTSHCMVLSEAIFVMLLSHEKYRKFTQRKIADMHKTSSALIALSNEAKADVDKTMEKAVKAGGMADPNPKQDLGFMYSRSIEDPDGHVWEIFWMDPAAAGS